MPRNLVTIVSIAFVAVLVGGSVGYYLYVHGSQDQLALVPMAAAYRPLIAEVHISGTTKAYETVDLAFKNGGIIDSGIATTGAAVATGTPLASLKSTALKSRLAEAEANLATQYAKLRDLVNGTRPEQIAVTRAQLASGRTNLTNAEEALGNALVSAQSTASRTVRFTIDTYFMNPSMQDSQLTVPVTDHTLGDAVLSERRVLEDSLTAWDTRVDSLATTSPEVLFAATGDMHTYLTAVAALTDDLVRLFKKLDATRYADARTALDTARSSITSAEDSLTAAEQKTRDAQAAISVVEQELALEEAGATKESIAAQRAVVDSIDAQIAQIKDELGDQIIAAPFSGIVTAVDAKAGETVAAGAPVVSMVSDGPLKIEGYVPEVHYADISVGQPVRITLDAFPGKAFAGVLGHIDPAATLRDGVPNFKVTVYFTDTDPRIRPGLTADAYIRTAEKSSVLAVPLSAVTGRGDSATVLREASGSSKATPVTLGSVGTDGYVEITSGLTKGDTVLVNETKQYRIIPN